MGVRRESSVVEGGMPRKRRESFSMDEGTNPQEMAERKLSMTQEFEARKNSILIEETIPEMAVETPSLEPVRTLGDGLLQPQPQPTARPIPDRTPTSDTRNAQTARARSPAARNGTSQNNGKSNAMTPKAEAGNAAKPLRTSTSHAALKPSASKPAPKSTPAPLAATKLAPASKAGSVSGPRTPTTPVKGATKTSTLKEAAKAVVPGKAVEKKTSKPPSTAPTRSAARPSLAKQNGKPTNAAADRPRSRVSAAADEGFLARMMRPTTASSSKTHEKPSTPPKHTNVAKRPTTRDGPIHDAGDKTNGSPVAKSSRQSSATEMGKSHASPPHKFVKPRPKSPTRPVKLPTSLMAPTAASQGKNGAVEEKPKIELKKTSNLTKSTKGTPSGTSSVGRKPSVLKKPVPGAEKKTDAPQSTQTEASKPTSEPVSSAPAIKKLDVASEDVEVPKEAGNPVPTEAAPETTPEITSEMTPTSPQKLQMPETEPEIPTAAKSVALKKEIGERIHEDAVAVQEEKAEEAAIKADETKIEAPDNKEPAVDEPKADESTVEELKADEPQVEVPKVEDHPAVQKESEEEEAVEEKKPISESVTKEETAQADFIPAPADDAPVALDHNDIHDKVPLVTGVASATSETEIAHEPAQQDSIEATHSETKEKEDKED